MNEKPQQQHYFTPTLLAVLGFTLAYSTAAIVGALRTGNSEFLFYIVVLAVMTSVVAIVHYHVRLTTGVLWCLSLWGGMHMAGGLIPVPESWPIAGDKAVLYSLWLWPEIIKYDQVVHAFGFGVATWVCWQCLKSIADAPRLEPRFGRLVLCIAGGMGFGALNEVIEFAAVLSLPETNVGGYINTGWDLVANLVGAIAAAVFIRMGANGS